MYNTQHKGWAVRSWDNIPSGAPIVPYFGTVHAREEYHPDKDTYILDLDAADVLARQATPASASASIDAALEQVAAKMH